MATNTRAAEGIEHCDQCGQGTPHSVRIDIRRDNPNDETGYSRTPYRIKTCRVCKATTAIRVAYE